MNITLYSTNCPRCNVLEKKLKQAGINFDVNKDFDINEMRTRGFMSAPILQVDENFMDFTAANNWIKTQIEG